VVSRRLLWWLAALLFCSPVLWWIDKSHTEAFTFSLLALAFALLREAPWWSMIALGAASSQNPPVAAVLLCVGAATLARRPGAARDARVWTGAAVAAAITLAHPVYYGWRWGLATPQLIKGTLARWPTSRNGEPCSGIRTSASPSARLCSSARSWGRPSRSPS
jgi:hypothetical protein